MYGGGGVGGTLVFRDISQVSDCDGTLYWLKPPTQSHSAYSQGFDLAVKFQATQFNPVIGGLTRDAASLDASGANLESDFSSSVTLEPNFPAVHFFGGEARNLRLAIRPGTDSFLGSFKDSTTGAMRSFTGVILPKSRSGAGYFFAGGLSGSVNIEY
jgi:hypothetical protein